MDLRFLCAAALLSASLLACGGRAAAQPVGIAYYDVDHLYDTVPSPFYNDDDRTPSGRLRWTAARYRRKVRGAAAVVDSMGLPLVALWGVENEAVVRDVAAACAGDYSYLHRTLNALDGMDFALLYYGDRFFPHYDEPGRRYLYIEGTLRRPDGCCDTLGILLCGDGRMAARAVGDLRDERPRAKLVVMGRVDALDAAAFGLRDALARAAAAGRGNVRAREGWRMRDRILIDTALRSSGGDVFARRWLLDDRDGYPLATYDRRRYRGGCGYALPVFTYIR